MLSNNRRLLYTILLILYCCFSVYGQIRMSAMYGGIGYQQSKLTEFNIVLTEYPYNADKGFDEVNGFFNSNIGVELMISKLDRLSLGVEFDRIGASRQEKQYKILNPVQSYPYPINDFDDFDPASAIDEIEYNYGYSLALHSLSFQPSYSIVKSNGFELEAGIGAGISHCNLQQSGFQHNRQSIENFTTADEKNFTSWDLILNARIAISQRIFENVHGEILVQYKDCYIRKIGTESDFIFESVNRKYIDFYPAYETSVDFSGMNYMLRLRVELCEK